MLGSLALAACSNEAPPTAPQGWEFVPGHGLSAQVNPVEYMASIGCRVPAARDPDSSTIVIPTEGGYRRFLCVGVAVDSLNSAIRAYREAVMATGGASMTSADLGDGSGGYYDYDGEECVYSAGHQEGETWQDGNYLYSDVHWVGGQCSWVPRYVWVSSSGFPPPDVSPGTWGYGGTGGGSTFPSGVVDFSEDLSAYRPDCAHPTGPDDVAWCQGDSVMTATRMQHIQDALTRMRNHSATCASLANVIQAVIDSNTFRVTHPGSSSGFAPPGLGTLGWMGVRADWVDQYYDSNHQFISTNFGSSIPMTLVGIFAHEADHLLGNVATGADINGHTHQGDGLVTPNQFACGL